jgi:hypothetical protein
VGAGEVTPSSIVLHHSASPAGNVATFRELHRARGWADVAYHAIITNGRGGPDGALQAGRPERQQGAGVWGNNKDRLQICLVGNFEKGHPGFTGQPTAKQLRTLGEWLIEKIRKHRIPTTKIHGHKEIALPGHGTACPGSEFPLRQIQRWCIEEIGMAHPRPLDVYLGAPDEEPEITVTLNGEPTSIRATVIDGVGYVAARDLAAHLAWPAPKWDGDARRLNVRTR